MKTRKTWTVTVTFSDGSQKVFPFRTEEEARDFARSTLYDPLATLALVSVSKK